MEAPSPGRNSSVARDMAITSRAARTTDLGSRATPAVVGPGSYLRTMNEPVMHAYAPFASTAERVIWVHSGFTTTRLAVKNTLLHFSSSPD